MNYKESKSEKLEKKLVKEKDSLERESNRIRKTINNLEKKEKSLNNRIWDIRKKLFYNKWHLKKNDFVRIKETGKIAFINNIFYSYWNSKTEKNCSICCISGTIEGVRAKQEGNDHDCAFIHCRELELYKEILEDIKAGDYVIALDNEYFRHESVKRNVGDIMRVWKVDTGNIYSGRKYVYIYYDKDIPEANCSRSDVRKATKEEIQVYIKRYRGKFIGYYDKVQQKICCGDEVRFFPLETELMVLESQYGKMFVNKTLIGMSYHHYFKFIYTIKDDWKSRFLLEHISNREIINVS